MKCPICSVDLVMADRSGIEIDYCPQCRGVWLDRGELDKIIERNAQASAPPPPTKSGDFIGGRDIHDDNFRRKDDDYRRRDDDDYYKRKKKGGLLGDLFDF